MKSNKIYPEDCIGFMDKLDKKSLDVIVTSPPYNLKKKYSKYKDNKAEEDYVAWMGDVAEHSKEALKDNGSFFLNIGVAPSDPWIAFMVAKEFNKHYVLQNTIHWVKSIAIPKEDSETKENHGLNGDIAIGNFKPINTPKYLNQCHEYIFHFTKEGTINILCVLWGLELRLACALITLNRYNGELYG